MHQGVRAAVNAGHKAVLETVRPGEMTQGLQCVRLKKDGQLIFGRWFRSLGESEGRQPAFCAAVDGSRPSGSDG